MQFYNLTLVDPVVLMVYEYFIHGKYNVVPVICVLFNQIFENGHFLEMWAEGYIIPFHKNGSKTDPNNFRVITLLSVFGK